jgi:hypothetical protein
MLPNEHKKPGQTRLRYLAKLFRFFGERLGASAISSAKKNLCGAANMPQRPRSKTVGRRQLAVTDARSPHR